MRTGSQKPAGPSLAGLTFGPLFFLSMHVFICVLYICVCLWVCTCSSTRWRRGLSSSTCPWSSAEQRSMVVAKTCISTFLSLHKGPCKPCIMQTGSLCPLSSFCDHCHACHSLPSAHATRRTPQPCRQRGTRKITGWPYLAISNVGLKALYKADWIDL